MNEVDVIKVDPRNTSKIGKEKYTKIKGLSVHYCAKPMSSIEEAWDLWIK